MADHEASSSSNATSGLKACSYHVFLSFRGEDTRRTFTDHLYTAFVNAGFHTFRDEEELERGEEIKPELQKAIQRSRSSVIVLSKDYASSGWCLDELVMILERKSTLDHVVLPVFYDVDPSHLRNQKTGCVAEAFAKHERNPSLKDKVKQWRAALTEVANLAGMVLQNEADGHEAEFIKKIVKVIEDKLSRKPLSVAPYLIGIHSQVEDINLWLQDDLSNVRIFVIQGMRGIGKTTIAKLVYNSNFKRFEGSSFLENIREVSGQPNGLVQIQKRLISDVLKRRKVKIHSISEGINKIEDALSSKRVLLVLDDVDHADQLEAIVSMQDRLYPGSKIIITTSRIGLLKDHQTVKMHNVEALRYKESLELFSWHAFGQDHPIEAYMEHSVRVIHHSGGLPLALKVLGSSLSGKSIDVWKDALNELEAIPDGEIVKKLRISFDSLKNDHDRNLFLHIASFFTGMDKYVIVQILEGCGFYAIVGIQNLIDRCLVTIDGYNKVQMHHMIRDMGRGIVRLESEEPRKRSRLWNHKDSLEVLSKKNGTKRIEGLVLNMRRYTAYTPRSSNEIVLETNAFARMDKLRFLQLTRVKFRGQYKGFLRELRWLCWNEYPFEFLPNDFPLERLVVLEMCYSSLRKVWKGTKSLPALKILNLSHSHGLTETPDFSLVPNLERLILKNCTSLVHVHESIGNLDGLVYLNVEDCKNIRRLPMEMMNIKSLKVLQADGIPIRKLRPRKNPEICWASCLPCNLVELSLTGCNLSDDDFPWNFGNLSSLRRLNLSCNPLSGLPAWIRNVGRLDELSLSQCTRLKSLEGLPNVGELIVHGCSSLETVTFQPIPSLPIIILDESNCKLVELEYYFKLEPLERVDVEMIEVLGLSKYLTSMQTIMMDTIHVFNIGRAKMQPIQGLHEYGIFNTFLPGNEVPGPFNHRSTLPKIYFTVPVNPNRKIRGLNIFSVYEKSSIHSLMMNVKLHFDRTRASYNPIATKVRNNTKRLEWIYGPSFFGVPNDGEQVIWLSHWKFGNQLEGGDSVKVSVLTTSELRVKECGVEIVYDEREEKMKNTQQNTTDIAPSFSGFDIGGNLSPSDMARKGQMITYFLCCRPEGLTESETHRSKWFNHLNSGFDETTVCFGEEAKCGESHSGIIAHDPRLPEGRGCTMQIKAFFLSLPLVDRLSLGVWRDSCELAWRSCFENRQNFRYFKLSSQDLPSPLRVNRPRQTLRTSEWCSTPRLLA